jgi:hypothetical protein
MSRKCDSPHSAERSGETGTQPPPSGHFGLVQKAVLAVAIFGIFFAYAASDVDWESLQTKHYWSARKWYYGGYASQLVETRNGYRAPQKEGLTNYSNIKVFQEIVPAEKATNHAEGFPAAERLIVPFTFYLVQHFTGNAMDIWIVFWAMNVTLWLLAIFFAYRVAKIYFPDQFAPWFAAILIVAYPALTLSFNAIKLQSLGTVYLLVGMYFFETHLRQARPLLRIFGLTSVIFIGLFSNGGWLFFTAFVFLRGWWLPRRAKWANIGCLGLAVLVAKSWLGGLEHLYHLPSVTQSLGFSFGAMFVETWAWLRALIGGRSVSGLKFLNYRGFTLFTGYWPLICRGFLEVNAPLVLVALAGLWFRVRSLMFICLALLLFLAGHSGTMLAGWVFHYGYL